MNITIYMSTLTPNVITVANPQIEGVKTNGDDIIIRLTKTGNNVKYIVTVPMLKTMSEYISSIWNKSESALSWERSIYEYKQFDETITLFYPSINIKFYHPSDMYVPNQYWSKTRIDVKNFNELNPYHIFICEVRPKTLPDAYNPFNKSNLAKYIADLELYNQQIIDLINKDLSLQSEFILLKEILQKLYNTIDAISIDKDTLIEISVFESIQKNLTTLKEKYTDVKIKHTLQAINKLIDNINQQIQNRKSFWLITPPIGMQEFIETQPYPRFGEYIQLRWFMHIYERNNNVLTYINKEEMIDSIKYESPLFTGGIITNKRGEGVDTRYDVLVYGEPFYNIMPTDFFDYEVGKWVYLLKANVNLTGEHQKYGSSDITQQSGLSDEKQYLFRIINQYRIDNGLEPLIYNTYLDDAIQKHVEDMATKDYVSHVNLEGLTAHDRISNAGYFKDLSLTALWGDSENLHKHTTITKLVFERNENGIGVNKYIVDYNTNSRNALQSWKDSAGHNANILNEDWVETGLGIYVLPSDKPDEFNDIYYGQVFAYREDGINVGIDSIYRITPFNFGGELHTQNKMAISYENDLFIDSELNFEKVFDMIQYSGEIKTVDYDNDKATVDIPTVDITGNSIIKTVELPIFYHCNGQPVTSGGSKAFSIGDSCVVKRLKEIEENGIKPDDFSDAYIVAHIDKLVPCEMPLYIVQVDYEGYNTGITQTKLYQENLVAEEYKGEFPVENIDNNPNYTITYNNLTIKCGIHGCDIFQGYVPALDTYGWATSRQSFVPIYKNQIIEFDITNNERYQRKTNEIELFNLINEYRQANNRNILSDEINLNLVANIYNEEMYDYSDRLYGWKGFLPEMPSTALSLKQQLDKVGYFDGVQSEANVDYIDIIETSNDIHTFMDNIKNNPDYIDKKNKLLSVSYREIGIGIFDNTIRIILSYKSIAVHNSCNTILDVGLNNVSQNWTMPYIVDINEVTINDSKVIQTVFVGYERSIKIDDITNHKINLYKYNLIEDNNPRLEQILFHTFNIIGKLIGCKIIDNNTTYIYYQEVATDNSTKDIKVYNTSSQETTILETVEASWNYNFDAYSVSKNYIIWNYLKRKYYIMDSWVCLMTIDGVAYILNHLKPNEEIIGNVKFLPDRNSFMDYGNYLNNELFHLEAILLNSLDNKLQAIIYSKHKTSDTDNWWNLPDTNAYDIYVIDNNGIIINLENLTNESFFTHIK